MLPALAAPILGAFALFFAWASIRNARALARHKATLDLIEKTESTDHYRSINRAFSALRRGAGLAHLNDPQNDADKAARQSVIDYLNHYELVAIGIREGLLDEHLYRAWMEGAFVRDWNAATQWIQRERWQYDEVRSWTYRDSLLANYQAIARRWSPEAVVLDARHSGPPAAPAGPSDEPLPTPADPPPADDPSKAGR